MQVKISSAPAVFDFAPSLSLRVFDADGNPWFVAADIEKMFGITSIRARVAKLDDDEKSSIPAPQGGSPLTIVNESGLWTLVLRSDSALKKGTIAYKARKWVTSEVLPAIRKTGRYECKPEPEYLTEEHAYQIMTAVAQRAKNIGAHYQTIYRALKARYQVTKYSHIRDVDFEDAMRFIQTVDLSVPEASPTHDHIFDETGRCRVCGLRPLPSDCAVFQPRHLQRLLMWVYTWRYLHRASLRRFDKLLHDMGSPFSASFHEAVIDPWMGTLEDILREHGYDVRSLPCYQYFATHGGEV